MKRPLLIVESPTKVKTIQNYLGKDYQVLATVGHIRDLPEKEMGVDVENGFKPTYITIPGKKNVISALKKAAEDVTDIYLAPDPDREGEAIAWHTAQVLKQTGRRFHRVLFHELTKKAILEAIQRPQEIDGHKFEAQQARRILDRLVGYQISPLLWKKVRGGLSAGRVQSVAVRMICEREREIQAFVPKEYWTITALLHGSMPPSFQAKVLKKNGKKLTLPDEAAAAAVVEELQGASFALEDISRKTTKRKPQPPYITSKLQQEAIRKLHFSAKKTMQIAQQLYEGVELEGGQPVGLITYMRTDSTRIAAEAAEEAIDFVQQTFGKEFTVGKPRFYANKNKVQDAHEAIRPTSIWNTPDQVKPYLNPDQHALYTLIWKRFAASQMADALIDTLTLNIAAGAYGLSAAGSSVRFAGFMVLYQSVEDEKEDAEASGLEKLPELKPGEALTLEKLDPAQHFTQPPPRYSEASLVKALEENGIGRPSTYAAILSTIRDKGYVELLKGYFVPSELGFLVNDLIVASFPEVFDVEFTARMESDLDRIEAAELEARTILERFYERLSRSLQEAESRMTSVKGQGVPTDIDCPVCKSRKLHIKMGKNGHFLACSGYPECRYTSDYTRDEKGGIRIVDRAAPEMTDRTCERCGAPMVQRNGKFGPFLACSAYPKCKHTVSLQQQEGNGRDTGVDCPQAGCDGRLVQRTSKRGKTFYGCTRYPECTFAIWDRPVARPCPQCSAPFRVEKTTKAKGNRLVCLSCGFEEEAEPMPPA